MEAIWSGSPRGQIERFLRIRDEQVERCGYPPLTDEVRTKILGLSAARLFGLDPAERRRAIEADRLTGLRDEYRDELMPSHAQ